jgi:hypothetical protein
LLSRDSIGRKIALVVRRDSRIVDFTIEPIELA